MIAFDDGTEPSSTLNGKQVNKINSDLTATINVTGAHALRQNAQIAFIGTQKGGKFELASDVARKILDAPENPNGRPNSDVVRPWINASDITGRRPQRFIIDFGTDLGESDAALYEQPFEYVLKRVRAKRIKNAARDSSNTTWWRHQRPRPEMRDALRGKTRFIVTPRHSKHRVFVWQPAGIVPDSALVVFARDDDYFFGVLQSSVHEIWARRKGTQVREAESGFRYTPTSTFETFPLPWPPNEEPTGNPKLEAVAAAARQLVRKRDVWLNPPGASKEHLRFRTLTKLYNEPPTWLIDAQRELDEAVQHAYGWERGLTDENILSQLMLLNAERFAAEQLQKELEFEQHMRVPKKDVESVSAHEVRRRQR